MTLAFDKDILLGKSLPPAMKVYRFDDKPVPKLSGGLARKLLIIVLYLAFCQIIRIWAALRMPQRECSAFLQSELLPCNATRSAGLGARQTISVGILHGLACPVIR